MTNLFTNPSAEDSQGIWYYSVLFGQTGSQFAALVSGPPVEAMYVDDENNLWAAFDIGGIPAGTSKRFVTELIFELNIYESGAIERNTGSLADIPKEFPSYKEYLKSSRYWEVDNPQIQRKAHEIVRGETNAYSVAKSIVEWVGKRIVYREMERYGALETLRRGVGDCDAFSDLTIALSRAAGLPARISMGLVYENDGYAGHAWVEFYLPPHGWQPADPTWARNWGNYLGRMDSIHLLQSTRGLDSVPPVPRIMKAGAEPKIEEETHLAILTKSQAAGKFIASAEKTIVVAERLLGKKLTQARSLLAQARTTDEIDTKISLAKRALGQANGVIRAQGKPPERGIQWTLSEWLKDILLMLREWLILVCILVAAIFIVVIGFKLRSRSQTPPFPLKLFKPIY